MSYVFISHVEEDESIAIDLATRLEHAGFETWYYERDVVPGPPYLLQVGQAIDGAAAVALIISPDSLGSHQVTGEVVRALESQKPFVPLRSRISHIEFQNRQPVWRQALGAAASIAVPAEGLAAIFSRVISGLQLLGVESHPALSPTAASSGDAATGRSSTETEGKAAAKCTVFVSSSSTDKLIAGKLLDYLGQHGYGVFASFDSEFSSDFAAEIDKALDSAAILIALASEPASLEKPWVQYEWRSFLNEILSGRKKNGILVPFVEFEPQQLPTALRAFQGIQYDSSGLEASFESLRHALGKLNMAMPARP